MKTWKSLSVAGLLVMGCSGSAIDVGSGSDGGAASRENGNGGTASSSENGNGGTTGPKTDTPITPEAQASPHLKKCTLACKVPTSGPCAGEDEGKCINDCAATVEGFKIACVQCLVENSGYAGARCHKLNEPGLPISFGPGSGGGWGTGDKRSNDGTSDEPPPTCATDPSMCPCTADKERCDGFEMAKTSYGPCASICAP